MTCRRCGAPTSRRLCRQCELEQRAEERARARSLEDDGDEYDDENDPAPCPDGGTLDIGTLHTAGIINRGGDAILTLKGGHGAARIHVPETMVDSVQEAATDLARFYAQPTDTTHIERATGDLWADGGTPGARPTPAPDLDSVEAERRARQAARSLNVWSRCARIDLLDILQEETPVRLGAPSPMETEHE